MDNECVCCGDEIPEGLQVCPRCVKKSNDGAASFKIIKIDSKHLTEEEESKGSVKE